MKAKSKKPATVADRLAIVGGIGAAFLPPGYIPPGKPVAGVWTVTRQEIGRWQLGAAQEALVRGEISGSNGTDCRIWLSGSKTAKAVISTLAAHVAAGRLVAGEFTAKRDGKDIVLPVYVTPKQAKGMPGHAYACADIPAGTIEFSLVCPDHRNEAYCFPHGKLTVAKASK